MDDPETWERPWTFEVPMKALDGEKWEYACHEGHHSMPHAGRRARPGGAGGGRRGSRDARVDAADADAAGRTAVIPPPAGARSRVRRAFPRQ